MVVSRKLIGAVCFLAVLVLNVRFVFFPEWFEVDRQSNVRQAFAQVDGASSVNSTNGSRYPNSESNSVQAGSAEQCVKEGFRHSDPSVILAGCINEPGRSSSYQASANFRIHVAHSAHEEMSDIVDALKQTARIFNECDIRIDDVALDTMLDGGLYHYVDRPDYFRMVERYRTTEFPEVFIVHAKDARWEGRYAGLAFIASGAAKAGDTWFRRTYKAEPTAENRQKLTNSILIFTDYLENWQNREFRNMQNGEVIAHELFHIYGDCGCHTKEAGNFMTPGGPFTANPVVTTSQCAKLVSGVKRFNRAERNGEPIFANSE